MLRSTFLLTLRIIVCCCVVSAFDVARVLETNQYLLVSEQSCRIIFETDVPGDVCPTFFKAAQKSNYDCKYDYHAHLVRDVSMEEPPMLLLIGTPPPKIVGKMSLILQPMIMPAHGRNGSSLVTLDIHKNSNENLISFSAMRNVLHSIFDARYRILYMISKNGNERLLHVFYMENGSSKNFRTGQMDISMMVRNLHSDAIERDDWFEDSYTFKAYYTQRAQNGTVDLFELPIEKIIDSLVYGVPGKKIFTFDDNRSHFSASSGILFSRTINANPPYVVTSYMRSLSSPSAKGLMCNHQTENTAQLPNRYGKFIVVRDWDYCVLRYGGSGFSSEECDKLRRNWMIQRGMVDIDSSSSFSFWVLLGFLVLTVVMCILLVCLVVRMRKNFADEMEKAERVPVPYYPTNPHYTSEMSHMDVSVDRWNY